MIALSSFVLMNTDGATSELVMWSVLGAIGVGFGEEMITQGGLLVGFRTKYTEDKVWLYTTLLFSALHIPNALFGESVGGMLGQLVLTFIFGSLLWATRRLAGTLLLSMFLHGLWDSSVSSAGDRFRRQLHSDPRVPVGDRRRGRGLSPQPWAPLQLTSPEPVSTSSHFACARPTIR